MLPAKPFRLAVKAVILDEHNRCLLLRRSSANKNFAGYWEWPGGKVDEGEDFATALHREALEETGLGVEITAHAGSTTFEMAHAQIVVLCLEARVLSGTLRLSDEHDDFVWAPLPELARWPSTPAVDAFMLDYARRKQSS